MEDRLKVLENEIEKLRNKIDSLEKNHTTNLENTLKSVRTFTNFMEDNNKLNKKIEANFITLEENDEKTYKKVNQLIVKINDINSGRI